MLMADDTSNLTSLEEFTVPADDADDSDLGLDFDDLREIMGEDTDSFQNSPEESLLNNMPLGSPNIDGNPLSRAEFSGSFAFSSACRPESSDSRAGISASSSESAGNSVIFTGVKLESSSNLSSPADSFSCSLNGWIPANGQSHYGTVWSNVSQNPASVHQEDNKVPLRGNDYGMFSFETREPYHVIDNIQTSDPNHVKCEFGSDFRHSGGNACSEYLSHNRIMTGYRSNASVAPNEGDLSMLGTDRSFYYSSHAQSHASEIHDALSERHNQYLGMYHMRQVDPLSAVSSGPYAPQSFNYESYSYDDDPGIDMLEAPNVGSCTIDLNVHYGGSDGGLSFPISNSMIRMNQVFHAKKEKNDEWVASEGIAPVLSETIDGVNGMNASGATDELSSSEGLVPSKEEVEIVHTSYQPQDVYGQIACEEPALGSYDHCLDVTAAAQRLSSSPALGCTKSKRDSSFSLPENFAPHCSKSHREIKNASVSQRDPVHDDADLCILEDISHPARRSISPTNGKSFVVPQQSFSKPVSSLAVGHVRHKTNAERFVFRAALQDLSQPKSEASPPDGFLAVPLLRHQRIALSWMVKKEVYGYPCSGGILADDQGLGKTISTIALLLKERSPSSAMSTPDLKPREAETLNLDDDDDGDDSSESIQADCSIMKDAKTSVQTRGRWAAGTLIVCPTSVLRQWSDELNNKVTNRANLSVLVYHGSTRTKDPSELAKYDVVLTTYSIVSMEMPKQPLVDEEDDDAKKRGCEISMELSSSKKRKYPPTSSKRPLKGKKGVDRELLESIASPLAKVGWFRVVLDEAQSIKNHRTQVARACWGLRAKRRWCLSGTPIQNAVDDLYSYFRFLRFEAYLKYKDFCSTIKVPIQRNPANGYKKLQAVLKTVMLRRTKGSRIDGEPIINLPPKTIELRKVDFTEEERDFYCKLEADSRAQFAEYAAAGTVKQNYVNILLMLLRLRQACDHPLLVRGYNSKSVGSSSVELAQKLPREKQILLLNCLQASQAICGLCSDPPEDAVVTICGHVFCNQCICEHLTGDDRQCPAATCKVQLNASSILSIETIKISLSDQPSHGGASNSSDCEVAEKSDPFASGYDSSKIRAALQVLQSLSKPQVCESRSSVITGDSAASEKLPDSCAVGHHQDRNESKNSDAPGCSNVLTKIAGEKAIVFSQWTRMLDLLEACLKNSSIQYRRLDGTMSVVARDKAVKDFNTLPEVSVMIMSLKAASLGLNMVAACHVLLLDLWWNPTTEDQAIDRAHRIGQTRPVTVVRLTVKDTVEDRILALQQKKREMVASAFGEDENGSRQTRLTVEDLKYLFGDVPL